MARSSETHQPFRIGISGWRYPPWRGTFYPKDLPQKDELAYASRQVNSIEINGSFYSLQRASSYRRWYESTPDDFIFSIKGGRYITHMLRLKEPNEALANFFASGVLELREKMGPFLWQLPPSFVYNRERLENFFELLPRTTKELAKIAKKHTSQIKKSHAATKAYVDEKVRHSLEVRNKSFLNPEFIDILRRHDIAAVVADTAGKWPYIEDVTSDFMYLRLHGDSEIYVSGYDDKSLNNWAKRIITWSKGTEPRDRKVISPKHPRLRKRDMYVYFDNDVKVRAPVDAISLFQKVSPQWQRASNALRPVKTF
jgi:uncharacterized protein YecE (DUF72 family)